MSELVIKLCDVSDDLGVAKNLLGVAYMATSALADEEGHPMAALLHEVRLRLDQAEARLHALRNEGGAP